MFTPDTSQSLLSYEDSMKHDVHKMSALDIGKRLYSSVVNWLRDMNVPSAKVKLERYFGMYRTGNPEIVPPVVDKLIFSPNNSK